MAKYNIPLSGSNKDGGELGDFQNIFKVLKYAGTVDATGIADGQPVVKDGIPAGFIPLYCCVKNVSTDAGDDLAAVAVKLDVETSADVLALTLSGLAAGASLFFTCEQAGVNTAAVAPAGEKDILAEAAAFKAASGKTVNWEIYVWGLSTENVASLGV